MSLLLLWILGRSRGQASQALEVGDLTPDLATGSIHAAPAKR